MAPLIPWRVKNFVSNKFPLAYHLIRNCGFDGNSTEHWDQRLAETWNDPRRMWPDKNTLIHQLTDENDAILDIACGNGSILKYLKTQGYQKLHGLEISTYAVNRLESEGINMCQGKLPHLPYPDDTFDAVIASQVLEHVIRRRTFAREIARVMSTDGKAFIFVPDDCMGPIDEKEHVIKYTQKSLHTFLSTYFTHVQVESIRDRSQESPILFALVQL